MVGRWSLESGTNLSCGSRREGRGGDPRAVHATLRPREPLNRRRDEVHLDGPAPFLAVPHTKTSVPKKVPLPKVAVEALKGLPTPHTWPPVLVMQGSPGNVVRKITGHRSRGLERYQHLSPVFRAQTVDLIAQVLLSGTPTDTPPPSEEDEKGDGPETSSPKGLLAGWTGLEPATSDVTGERNRLSAQRLSVVRQRVRATRPDTRRHEKTRLDGLD
jgi:hypothetical protein